MHIEEITKQLVHDNEKDKQNVEKKRNQFKQGIDQGKYEREIRRNME